jgi:hypothetical protein
VVRIVRTLVQLGRQTAVENKYVAPGGSSAAANSTGSGDPAERVAVTISVALEPWITDSVLSPDKEKLNSSDPNGEGAVATTHRMTRVASGVRFIGGHLSSGLLGSRWPSVGSRDDRA